MRHEVSNNTPDSFSSSLIAIGTGTGEGTAEHAKKLGAVLGKLTQPPR